MQTSTCDGGCGNTAEYTNIGRPASSDQDVWTEVRLADRTAAGNNVRQDFIFCPACLEKIFGELLESAEAKEARAKADDEARARSAAGAAARGHGPKKQANQS